jgi:hypothetical protein
MEPDYHALEFDLRLWLTALELQAQAPAGGQPRGAESAGSSALKSGAQVPLFS